MAHSTNLRLNIHDYDSTFLLQQIILPSMVMCHQTILFWGIEQAAPIMDLKGNDKCFPVPKCSSINTQIAHPNLVPVLHYRLRQKCHVGSWRLTGTLFAFGQCRAVVWAYKFVDKLDKEYVMRVGKLNSTTRRHDSSSIAWPWSPI